MIVNFIFYFIVSGSITFTVSHLLDIPAWVGGIVGIGVCFIYIWFQGRNQV